MASDLANPRLAGKESEPRRSVARSLVMRMLTAARGAVPGLAPGKLNVEYVAMDGTLHAVPLADAARGRLTDMQPSRRFKARKGHRNLPGRWWSVTDGRHLGGRHLCAGSGSRRTPDA